MGYEAELSQHYKVIHNKLFPSKPKTLKPAEIKSIESKPISAPEQEPQVRVFVKNQIAEAMPTPMIRVTSQPPTVKQIINWVCAVESISPKDLRSTAIRERRVSWARFIVCHLARKYTTKSLEKIGRELGKMDHSSVHHAIKRVARMRITNPVWQEYLTVYERLIEKNLGDCGDRPHFCPSCPWRMR